MDFTSMGSQSSATRERQGSTTWRISVQTMPLLLHSKFVGWVGTGPPQARPRSLHKLAGWSKV